MLHKLLEYIDLSEIEAIDLGAANHIPVRIVRKEGIPLCYNKKDINPYRINLTIINGKVIKATYG